MYFDVTFKDFSSVPDEIAHRVSASAAVTDKTPGPATEEPPIVENPIPPRMVAIGGAVKVKTVARSCLARRFEATAGLIATVAAQ